MDNQRSLYFALLHTFFISLLNCVALLTLQVSAEEVIHIDSTGYDISTPLQKDNSRIYLPRGAIWVSRDMTRFDPVLTVRLNNPLIADSGMITEGAYFNVQTNFSYYIKHWELSIYDDQNGFLVDPLVTIQGSDLPSNGNIQWQGKTSRSHYFKAGESLYFRLKACDDEVCDTTTIGITQVVKQKPLTLLDSWQDLNGTDFGEATLLRHLIQTKSGMAKFTGTGLQDVASVKIGMDEYTVQNNKLYGEQFLKADAYVFPVSVIYRDGDSQNYELFVRIPENYFIQTGLFDLTIGQNFVSGNQDLLSPNHQYQDDLYHHGRLAYFAEGKWQEKWRWAAAVDTYQHEIKDLFKQPFASREHDVFAILEDEDPELYYPTYGDDANIEKRVNTKGKVFLDLEYDQSRWLWGNYNTGITGTETGSYNRSLYGFKTDMNLGKTTQFGDQRININGFAAEADTAFGHDEFLATGTSVYFLRQGEVIPGSDKVFIRQIDQVTHQILAQITLTPGVDYRIDPFQGRIILTQPLATYSNLMDQPVIDQLPGGASTQYLVVDYEYLPRGNDKLDNLTAGGRVKAWLTDYLGLGATYINEDRDSQHYVLQGGDLNIKLTETSQLKLEVAHSEGTQVASNFVSLDGGLSFNPQSALAQNRSGKMVKVNGLLNLHDVLPDYFLPAGNDIQAWYQDKEAGFSYASQFDALAQTIHGLQYRYRYNDRLQWLVGYQKSIEKSQLEELLTDNQAINTELGWLVTDAFKSTLAIEQIKELDTDKKTSDAMMLGLRLDYLIDERNRLFIKGQKTTEASTNFADNDSVTLGAAGYLMENITLSGDYTIGDRGNQKQASIGYDRTQSHNLYLTYLGDDYQGKNNLVVGQRGQLTSKLSAFQENQFVDENNGKGRLDAFGFDYRANQYVQGGVSFQQGEILSGQDTTERTAGSLYVQMDTTATYINSKVEARVDKGETRQQQIATINRFQRQLSESHRLYSELNYTQTKDRNLGKTIQRFIEGNLGLAYRPVINDRWNLLSRYTLLQDYDRRENTESKDERSHIIEAEQIFDINALWSLGNKIAWKKKQFDFLREDDDSIPLKTDIYLLAVSGSYHLMKNWDIALEYHFKADRYYQSLLHGALVAFNKLVSQNLKLGIGYNFSHFDDDLVHRDHYDAHGFFINLIGFF